MSHDYESILLQAIAAVVVAVAAYQWVKTRSLLQQMTKTMDEMLKTEGMGSVNLFQGKKVRGQLSMLELARRLSTRIEKLKERLLQPKQKPPAGQAP